MRWIGRILIVLVVLALIAVAAVYVVSGAELNRKYDIASQSLALTIPTDAASVSFSRRATSARPTSDRMWARHTRNDRATAASTT